MRHVTETRAANCPAQKPPGRDPDQHQRIQGGGGVERKVSTKKNWGQIIKKLGSFFLLGGGGSPKM